MVEIGAHIKKRKMEKEITRTKTRKKLKRKTASKENWSSNPWSQSEGECQMSTENRILEREIFWGWMDEWTVTKRSDSTYY